MIVSAREAVQDPVVRHLSARTRSAILASAVLAVVLAGSAAASQSVTVDEFGYLPHGLAWLKGTKPRVIDGNPPLFKMLSALPVLALSHRFDPSWAADPGGFWPLGRQFMDGNRADYHRLFMVARLVPLFVLGCTCLLTSWLALRVYGEGSAVVAGFVTALSPTLLAHGSLVTPDIFVSAAILLAVHAFMSFLEKPSSVRAMLLGGAIGLACLFKGTGLLFAALVPAAAILATTDANGVDRRWWHPPPATLWTLVAITVWIVLCAGYGFEGVMTPWREAPPEFAAGFLQRHIGWLPVLLPSDYVNSLVFQANEPRYPAYLDRVFRENGGFADYYVRGMFYKTPLVTTVAIAAGVVLGGRIRSREYPVLVVACGLFGLFSILGFKNIGVRYVLVVWPLAHVFLSRLVKPGLTRRRAKAGAAVALCVIVGSGIAEAQTWPHHLAYFNAVSGGPVAGPRHMLDSNVDWGQGLIELRRFMMSHHIDTIQLAYAGRVDPAVYGIHYRELGPTLRPGWVAASVNLIYGRMYFVNGGTFASDPFRFLRLQDLEPVSRTDYSIYVYRIGN